jgi:hypothetical protein
MGMFMFLSDAGAIHGKEVTAAKRSIRLTHEVKQGETLYGINRIYYLSGDYQSLAKYNNIGTNQRLTAGMKLLIPNPVLLGVHTVKPGETLYGITNNYFNRSTYLKYAAEFNGLYPGGDLLAGAELWFPLPPLIRKHTVQPKETLYGLTGKYFKHADFERWIADYNGIGDSASDLKAGSALMIPNPFRTVSILSEHNRFTIEIEKKKNKLYLIKNGTVIRSFPIASGRQKELTPTGTFTVVTKLKDPWYTAKNIRGGDPKNPLGSRWLGLNALNTDGTKYGIHGTNDPSSIGRYASSGCVRMNNRDVEWLYDQIPVGTKVIIRD